MQLVGKGYSVISKDIRVEFDKFIYLKDAIRHIRKYKNRYLNAMEKLGIVVGE